VAELKIERDHPGKTARYWKDGDVVVVQIGRDVHPWRARRLIQDAQREYGIRRHGGLPIVLPIPGALRRAARDHPSTTAVMMGILAVGMAASALYGTGQLGDDNTRHRRRPPVVAGPAPTPGPSRTTPPPGSSAPPAPPGHRAGPSSPPGEQDGPARPPAAAPIGDRPDAATATTPDQPPAAPSTPPTSTPPATGPPATSPPPATPSPRRCLVDLSLPPLLRVDLLC
jgi:hypothetical protein